MLVPASLSRFLAEAHWYYTLSYISVSYLERSEDDSLTSYKSLQHLRRLSVVLKPKHAFLVNTDLDVYNASVATTVRTTHQLTSP